MDDTYKSPESYCLDFSDIYNEEIFWDFLKGSEEKQEAVSCRIASDETFSYFLQSEKGCDNSFKENSQTTESLNVHQNDSDFWDFLKIKEENHEDLDSSQACRSVPLSHKVTTKEQCHKNNSLPHNLQDLHVSEPLDSMQDILSLKQSGKRVLKHQNISPEAENSQSKIAEDETEDEFWSFLKQNDPSLAGRGLTKEEFEEMISLSSMCASEIGKSEIAGSVTSETKDNFYFNENIFRDLDAIMAGINATISEMKNQPEKHQPSPKMKQAYKNDSHEGNNVLPYPNSNTESHILSQKNSRNDDHISQGYLVDANKSSPTLIFTNSLGLEQKKLNPRFQSQKPHNISAQSCRKKTKLSQSDMNFTKKQFGKPFSYLVSSNDHMKTAGKSTAVSSCIEISSNSEILQNGTKYANNIIDKKVPNYERSFSSGTESKANEKGKLPNSEPVISSFFSLSSCPNLFDGLNIAEDPKQLVDLNVNSATNCSTELDNCNRPTPLLGKSFPSPDPAHESEVPCNNLKNIKIQDSTQIQKNVKRQLSLGSPKNSEFKVIDSVVDSRNKCSITCVTLNDMVNSKKQKTSETGNNADLSKHSNLVITDNKTACQVTSFRSTDTSITNPVSTVTVSTSSITVPTNSITLPTLLPRTTNAVTSNTAPIYLIIPKNFDSDQNKNAELLMVIGNSNLASNIKTTSNQMFSTVPVSLLTHVPRPATQIREQQFLGKTIQPVSVPSLNAVSLPQNTPAVSSNFQATILYEPSLQSTANGAQKLEFLNNATATNNLRYGALHENSAPTNNVSVCTLPIISSKPSGLTISQASTCSVLSNNFVQSSKLQREVNGKASSGGLFTINIAPSNQIIQTVNSASIPVQSSKLIKQKKFKPLKSIALGNDKNAIQQISVPLKMDNVLGLQTPHYVNVHESNPDGSRAFKVPTTCSASVVHNITMLPLQTIPPKPTQHQNRVFNCIPYKPRTDSVLVKRDIITNETEIITNNQFFSAQQPLATSKVNYMPLQSKTSTTANCAFQNPNQAGIIPFLVTSAGVSTSATSVNSSIENMVVIKNKDNCPQLHQNSTQEISQKDALATIKELFPPPISMIPISVVQTVQTTNKPSVSTVLVLQSSNFNNKSNNIKIKTKNQGKMPTKKMEKVKKPGRKTVKELLQERYQRMRVGSQQSKVQTKILKPIFKLPPNGVRIPSSVSINDKNSRGSAVYALNVGNNITVTCNPSKRPNIMILPSAARSAQENILQSNEVKKKSTNIPEPTGVCGTSIFDPVQDFIFEKIISTKDCRPRYYDMSELRIGYFKVDDDIDSCGRFRSKFKVLFKKCMFTYDFPVAKCNQMDLCNSTSWEQMAFIQVPFKIIMGMKMSNRNIFIQVKSFPQVGLKRLQNQERSSIDLVPKPHTSDSDSLWLDAVQNSLIHKIILRKRQADNLKTFLCQLDPKFLSLFHTGCNIGHADLSTLLFEEELVASNLNKINQKNKRNMIRRPPQWDSETIFDSMDLLEGDHQLSNYICSCRISCKSLRCSCVKAAKGCRTGGTTCLCTNCDNPLDILESHGVNLKLSLKDCCLFQNIYQIQNIGEFLKQDVKLTCCNTLARLVDCIPGTILCPNIECYAYLEFSWCRNLVCYPERNPRQHCSICGQCCFSIKRHCPICQRCYSLTSKSSDCPTCRGSSFFINPIGEPNMFDNNKFEMVSVTDATKPCSKPEIVLLDSSFAPRKCASDLPPQEEKDIGKPEEHGTSLSSCKKDVVFKNDKNEVQPQLSEDKTHHEDVEMKNESLSVEENGKYCCTDDKKRSLLAETSECPIKELKSVSCESILKKTDSPVLKDCLPQNSEEQSEKNRLEY